MPTADITASVAAFSRGVLRMPLWKHQLALAETDAFIRVVAAARRTGKSTIAEVEAAWTAMRTRNTRVLILSATQESSRRMCEGIAAMLNGNPLTKGAVADDFSTRITLTNGSQIISLPASEKQVRGYGVNVRLVIGDECGFMAEGMWAAMHYCAMDERPYSRILLLGTPWGAETHFFRQSFLAGQDPENHDYASVQWKADVNPRLDHAYLERQRERVSPVSYASEVEGEWSSAVGGLFPTALLEAQTAPIDIPALSALRGPARGCCGCDWGASHDQSALGAIFRLPVNALNAERPRASYFVALPYVWPVGTALHQTVEDTVRNIAPFAYVVTETNGIGAMPSSELRRRAAQTRGERRDKDRRTWLFVATTQASKALGYGLLLGLMQKGQLVLPNHPPLLRQLAGLQIRQGERGLVNIEAELSATRDDIADSLYLATLPHRPPQAHRYVCHLAALAGTDRIPDARVPEVESPLVETGGGLKLPQQPTLQSVAGTAFTTYAPVQPVQPEGFQAGRFFVKTTARSM